MAPCITSSWPAEKPPPSGKHHDAGEADAATNIQVWPLPRIRALRGPVDAHDGDVIDEGAGDRRDETGELTDDLLDDRGLLPVDVPGVPPWIGKSERRTWAAQSFPGSRAAQLTS